RCGMANGIARVLHRSGSREGLLRGIRLNAPPCSRWFSAVSGGEGGIRTPRYGCPYGAAFVKGVRAGAAQWLSVCRARRSRASGLALGEQLSKACGLREEMFHEGALSLCGLTIRSVLPGTVRFAFWCSTSRTVEPADVPAANGRSLAALFSPFRHGGAAWSLLEGIL